MQKIFPYFNEHQKYDSLQEFKESTDWKYLFKDSCSVILVDNQPIGMVSKYWIDQSTRWIEIGNIIYDENFWSSGIGTKALKIWISQIFKQIDELEHIRLTTWSGNLQMMALSEKFGLKKEAQIRKVRYYQGVYYDSIKYGILRDEWLRR